MQRRLAWITGASSGIGAALALRMARDGWHVVASARSADDLARIETDAAALDGKIDAFPLDVTDRAAVMKAVQEIEDRDGPITQAILNAGTHMPLSAKSFSTDIVRRLVEVNVMGTVHGLDALLPRMIARHSGRIAMVASVAGYRGLPTGGAYGLTKAGLINLAESLQPELVSTGVVLQIVNPGFVKTPLTEKNDFPMPFLMDVDAAADAFYRGLLSNRFEITFPRRMAWLMKLYRLLPYPLMLALARRMVPDA